MGRFIITGIKEPGRINIKIDGLFIDVELFSAPEEELEKLFNDGCQYIQLSPDEFLKRNPNLETIQVNPIKIKKTANKIS